MSGSFPGEIYWFSGQEGGEYAASVTLKHRDGKPVNIGSAAAVEVADWDSDGDLDLLIGNIDGEVFFVPCETTKPLAYGESIQLRAGQTFVEANFGDAGPCVADWDQDGHLDLLLGDGDGSVHFFRNKGAAGLPQLARGTLLIGPTSEEEIPFGAPPQRGSRSKVDVTDWNQDGVLDLLVGDFSMVEGEQPEMTAEEEAEYERHSAVADAIEVKMAELEAKLVPELEELYVVEEFTPELEAKIEELYAKLEAHPEYASLETQFEAVFDKMMPFEADFFDHGYVWLYLGQAIEADAAPSAVKSASVKSTPAAPRSTTKATLAPVNDRALVRDFEQAATAWDRGAVTSPQTLVSQLSRKSCTLDGPLPERRTSADFGGDIHPSVVVVGAFHLCDECDELHASCAGGFFISDRGDFVTNYHVIDQPDAEMMMVRTWDGRHYAIAEVLAAHQANDVAIVRLEIPENDDSTFVPLPLGTPARIGDDAYVLSHPDHHFFVLTRGMVSRYHIGEYESGSTTEMAITADYAVGSSGCPILDRTGNIIGIVCSTETLYAGGSPGELGYGPYGDEAYPDEDDGSGDAYGEYDDYGMMEGVAPQMVMKSCVPVDDIRALLEKAPRDL